MAKKDSTNGIESQARRRKFDIFAPEVRKELYNRNNHSVGRHTENFTIDPDPWAMQRFLPSADAREYFFETFGYHDGLTNKPSWFDNSAFYRRQARRDGPHATLPNGYEAYYRGDNRYVCISPQGHIGIWHIDRRKEHERDTVVIMQYAWEGNLDSEEQMR